MRGSRAPERRPAVRAVPWISLVLSVAALAVAIAALMRPGGSVPGPPRLVFEKLEHDFGEVAPRRRQKTAFPFRNAGDRTLRIRLMRPCCGIEVSASAFELPPDGKAEVTVEWRPGVDIGEDAETVTVGSNDPELAEAALTLRADVTPPFEIEPAEVDFGGVLYDAEAVRTVVVRSRDERPLVLKAASTHLPGVKAAAPSVGTSAMSHTITLTARPAPPPRRQSGQLHVRTDFNEEHSIRIPVRIEVVGRVRPFPDRLDFEAGAPPSRAEAPASSGEGPAAPVERLVRLEAREGLRFRIKTAWTTDGSFRVAFANAPPARRQEIRVSFLPSEAGERDSVASQLHIRTDLKDEPEVRVSLSARLTGGGVSERSD
jgi:hypothetical protein